MRINDINKPEFIMMVGPPGSGKSTQITSILKNNIDKEYVVLSLDQYIEEYAKKNNISYSEAYRAFDMKRSTTRLMNNLKAAIKSRKNIIFDQTNMSVRSRAKKLSMLPKEYYKIAYVFEISRDDLERRLSKREQETGKFISPNVIDLMIDNYQEPTKSEFNKIIKV